MKKIYLLLLIVSCDAVAQSESNSLNLAIPNSASSYQTDRIRAGDTECQMAIGSATKVEFGVVGILNEQTQEDVIINMDQDGMVRDVGVYARITIPIGAPKERLDCAEMYKLELERQRLELEKLKEELEQIKNLQFEE